MNMELREKSEESFEEQKESSASEIKHKEGELFIERDKTYELEDEDQEAFGVYIQLKDKITLGVFWDKVLAEFFLNSIKSSDLLPKIKKEVVV
jgi:sucrose-6-phosphate hydrolase SacC (GH32 family)